MKRKTTSIPVLNANDPDFTKKFGEAVGIQPGDTVEFITPQFHREKGAPSVHPPPEPFERIHDLSYEEIRSLGCRPWDEPDDKGCVLLLFPGEWYSSIPNGFRVRTIGDRFETFKRHKTDDDIRFGCLSFGVLKKKAVQ